jgi:phosphoglycerate dehydrogenase-like enzyme
MKNLVIISKDWKEYKVMFSKSDYLQSQFNLVSAYLSPDNKALKTAEVVLGDPDLSAPHIKSFTHLKWLQSTWAGNNRLQAISKQDYILSGVKGIFGQQMFEYLLSYLLFFTRRIDDFDELKKNGAWSSLECKTLSQYKIGILGMGNIGQEVAQKLLPFGMKINGMSNKHKHLTNINHYTLDNLAGFLENCDFVFNLLPETPSTIGLCNTSFFNQMKPGSVFINAGRGSVIDSPKSIISALQSNHLKAAVLDVFEHEPLPNEHPFYITPRLYLSCHTAAVSQANKVFEVFEQNARKYLEGKPLLYLHNFASAY